MIYSFVSDKRHNARIFCLQRIFEQNFQQNLPSTENTTHNIEDLLEINELEGKDIDLDLADKIFQGVTDKQQELDDIIIKFAPEWPLDKIAQLDLQILRMAIFEGFFEAITPKRVAIDEAIELAKEFSNDQSRKFISGVLGSLYEQQKQEDD